MEIEFKIFVFQFSYFDFFCIRTVEMKRKLLTTSFLETNFKKLAKSIEGVEKYF